VKEILFLSRISLKEQSKNSIKVQIKERKVDLCHYKWEKRERVKNK